MVTPQDFVQCEKLEPPCTALKWYHKKLLLSSFQIELKVQTILYSKRNSIIHNDTGGQTIVSFESQNHHTRLHLLLW